MLKTEVIDENSPLYNSRVTNTYIEYLSKFHPDVDIDAVLKMAGMTRHEVDNPAHWFSQRQVDRFHEIAVSASGNPHLSQDAGRYTISSKRIGAIKQYCLGLMSLSSVYLMVNKLSKIMTRGADAKAKKLKTNMVEIVIYTKSGVNEKKYQCENRLGTFESLAHLFSEKYAKVDHPECIHHGGEFCRYIVSWETSLLMAWKRIQKFSLLLSLVIPAALFFELPKTAWANAALLLLLAFFAVSLRTKVIESAFFKKTIENQGNAAKDLLDEINIRHANALLIQEIGKATAANIEIEELAKSVLEIIGKHLEFRRGIVMLAAPKSDDLVLTADSGFDEQQDRLLGSRDFSEVLAGELFASVHRTKETLLANELPKAGALLSARGLSLLQSLGVESFICVPLIYETESLGVLYLDNNKAERHLVQSEISLLTGIASQMAVGIVNARSFRKLQESEEALKRAYEGLEIRVAERTAELVESERHLIASLKEKEFLLREVHHRVKNNLQIVTSLLDMTKRRSKNKETFDLLSEAHAKIETMSLIHSQLYKSNRFDRINVANHLKELVQHLSQLYDRRRKIDTHLKVDGIHLSVTQAVPCALILNELISNAYKYAFADGRRGTIDIDINKDPSDETVRMRIKDDGIGLPAKIDILKTGSLGLKLVRNLVSKQLKGQLAIESRQGTKIDIAFVAQELPPVSAAA